MRLRRLLSVLAVPLVLAGCAKYRITPEGRVVPPGVPVAPPPPLAPPPPVAPETVLPHGRIAARPGKPGLVVAAPHGTSDARTADIATAIAERTGFGLVVASGFAVPPDGGPQPARRYEVNRPLEGVAGRPPVEEVPTAAARAVYDAWERQVRQVAGGPLALYVEIHGNGRQEAAARIEVATVGVDREYAFRLRTLYELIRDAHVRGHAGAPRLPMLVEPADAVVFAATGAKREGILRLPQRALHIELPRAARVEWQALYTEVLGDFLLEAARLRPPR